MISFDILAKETVLKPRLFLEASAGTGKTFAIEHLFVRLLLETSMTIEEIVIVTFTRAATRELKERIRSNLESQKTADYPYLKDITAAQRDKIEEALKNFDSAKIFTIHGFCSHLLSQFALQARVGLALSEWTNKEARWEVKEFLRTQTTLSSGQLRRLLGSFQYDMDQLEEDLMEASGKSMNIPAAGKLLEQINSVLKTLPFFSVIQEFESAKASYKGMTSDHFTQQVADLEKALAERHLSSDLWNEWILDSQFCLKNLKASQLKVRAKSAASEGLLQLREIIVPRLETAQNSRLIFSRLVAEWASHRNKIAEQNEKITPDDLLRLVHSKLREPALISSVRQKYQAAIIDEFQDTDPLQWEIFKTLFVDDPQKSVYLVGDPKQSIYAFRQADLYTFLSASQSFDPDQKVALLRNFRSSSELISQLNSLLSQTPWMEIPKEAAYLPVPEALSVQEGEGKLCFMVASGEKGRSSKWPSLEMEETQFFPFITQEILKNGLDAAILVKDRYQAARVKKYLELWGVPTTLHRTSPLATSPAIGFLEEVAEACLEESTLKKVLLGPFARVPLHELTQQVVFEARIEFQKLQNFWEKGFAPFFAAFLKSRLWKETAYTTFCTSESHEDLMELIQKVLFVSNPYQLKMALEEIKREGIKDRIIPASEKGVQIMTIHASKGLEFETVFALGLASRSPEQELTEEELKELDAEKMRQFYVALTRAKKNLYIPIAKQLPESSYALGEGSPVELFLAKVNPDLSSFAQEILSGRTFHLKSAEKQKQQMAYVPLKETSPLRYIQSFSSLAQESFRVVKGEAQGIAPGIETGLIVHRILERHFNNEAELETIIVQETAKSTLSSKAIELEAMIQKALALPLGNFCLNSISFHHLQTEMEFFYETEQGWMKGYIDLCFEHEGVLYAVDWKTNLLENADPGTVLQAMQANDYLLQGKIYTEAMQKYLTGFPHLSFGGVYFIFVRGPAVYHYEA